MSENAQATSWQDKLIWLVVVALIIGGIVANSHFEHYQFAFRMVGWALLLTITIGLAYVTRQGKDFASFAKDSRNELRKVVWPSRQETAQTALIVMVIVIVTGVILWGVDNFFLWLVGLFAGQGAIQS